MNLNDRLARANSSERAKDDSSDCIECGFGLWRPILRMSASAIGLYSDSRFPGRCIVTMQDHFDHLSDVPIFELMTFMEEIQLSIDAIKQATSSPRVNVAILGNAESHVHAHLVPRKPSVEPLPNKAPWEDPRPKNLLPGTAEAFLMDSIKEALEAGLVASMRQPNGYAGRRKPRSGGRNGSELRLFDLLSDGEPVH